ncbi:MAG: ribbon-helix-helix domain-containing protein [Sphaerospermopsis kisseleviana]
MKPDKKRVTIVLNMDVYEELAEIAESEARSLTSLVTYAVLQLIKERKNNS